MQLSFNRLDSTDKQQGGHRRQQYAHVSMWCVDGVSGTAPAVATSSRRPTSVLSATSSYLHHFVVVVVTVVVVDDATRSILLAVHEPFTQQDTELG